ECRRSCSGSSDSEIHNRSDGLLLEPPCCSTREFHSLECPGPADECSSASRASSYSSQPRPTVQSQTVALPQRAVPQPHSPVPSDSTETRSHLPCQAHGYSDRQSFSGSRPCRTAPPHVRTAAPLEPCSPGSPRHRATRV